MIDKERFKRIFPHLAEEMEEGESKIQIDHFSNEVEREDQLKGRMWAKYDPDVVDFIRRCDNVEQAEEIIDYMEMRGEITTEIAAELRRRLSVEGLGGFGDKKQSDFYHREG